MHSNRHLITPLTSLVILTLGSALLTTFLSLKLHMLGVSPALIGGLSTAYYGGMVIGAFKLEAIILRIGHIRAYSACASILSVAAILHGLYINEYFWLALRFFEGIATAGLYIVIESWILSSSDNSNRGTSLAIYMIALYIAQSIGQWLLNIGHQDTLILYAVSSVFASLSVIPLSLTKASIPTFSEPDTLSIKSMFLVSPSGVMTCFVSGLTLGSLYGLFPIYIQHIGYPLSDISTIMALTIFGGMIFQYPIGKLSDNISRRYVIAMLSFSTTLLSTALLFLPQISIVFITLLSFFLGGAVFCLYPIGISHACDRVENNQIISATQTLLFSYGIGATIGPSLAPLCNYLFPGSGILLFFIITSLPLGIFMLWRKGQASSVHPNEKHDFTLSIEMTPVATEMDPRAEVEN
ncbi:MAG: MFS transporter [Coxiellaceae bacterium]|nr:MFS transporter [Coxiellaceae bacterium]